MQFRRYIFIFLAVKNIYIEKTQLKLKRVS